MRSQFGKQYGWQLLVAMLIGCGASRPPQVINVATHDLACDQVDVSEVARDRYAAYGCGRGAVYARVCEGQSCRWGRLRHGHEESVAAGSQSAPAAPREILPAPAPEPREVVPAPAPAQREILPAPAPSSAAPAPDPGAAASAAAPQPLQNAQPAAGASDPNAAPVALSQGYLSDPYQATVPDQPIAQQVLYPPPAPLIETRPLPPVRNYVWISGYWWWGPANWVWVPGYWCPPYYGYSYIAGSWYWGSGYWRYSPGGWARPGTTVIVHHGFHPRPSTSVTVRAFTPYRAVGGGYSGVHRVTQSAPGGYRPSASPLYPSQSRGVVRAAPSGYGYGSSSHYGRPSGSYSGTPGRVVSPGSTVRAPSSFGNSYRSAPSHSYGSSSAPVYRATPSHEGGRSYSSGYSGGSGGRSYGGGGGGRSFSSGGGGGGGHSYGGGGGGGRSMGSVRVGGGGGHRR